MKNFIFKTKTTETAKKYYLFGIQVYNKKIQSLDSTATNCDISSYLRFIPQNYLKLLLVNVVEQCNLNCINCCHFSSLASEEFLKLDSYERDIKRLLELTGNKPSLIQNIQLCGGEPLLHPELVKFFEISRKYFPDNQLTIVTNGILLNSQDDSFWVNCNKYNVTIAPTVYPIKIKWEEIEKKAKLHNVMLDYGYVLYETRQTKPDTLKTSWHWPFDLNGNKDPLINFSKCNVGNNCVTLHDGKIYTCSLPTGIKHFNKYFNKNLKVVDADGIDIYSAKSFKEILEFVSKPIPFCRYCDVQKRTFNHPWSCHTKNDKNINIKEWTL